MEKAILETRLQEIGPEVVQEARRRGLTAPLTITLNDDSRARAGRICVGTVTPTGAVRVTEWRDEALAKTDFPTLLYVEDDADVRFGPATLRETRLQFP
jgi:hypothetical protein